MKARRKEVAPVTPRIVQTDPGRRFLQYALLSCAFLLAVWFSYDYGKKRAATDAEVPLAQSGDAERDITGLEQERDTLRQQVAELQHSMKQARQDLKAAQARIQSLQQAESSARESAETPPTPAVATEPEPIPVSAEHCEGMGDLYAALEPYAARFDAAAEEIAFDPEAEEDALSSAAEL